MITDIYISASTNLPVLALLSLAGSNAILELMNSTMASHGSRTEKVFVTTPWLSMKLNAVLSPNATVNGNSSKSYTIILSLTATQENSMTTNQWLITVSDYLCVTALEH